MYLAYYLFSLCVAVKAIITDIMCHKWHHAPEALFTSAMFCRVSDCQAAALLSVCKVTNTESVTKNIPSHGFTASTFKWKFKKIIIMVIMQQRGAHISDPHKHLTSGSHMKTATPWSITVFCFVFTYWIWRLWVHFSPAVGRLMIHIWGLKCSRPPLYSVLKRSREHRSWY